MIRIGPIRVLGLVLLAVVVVLSNAAEASTLFDSGADILAFGPGGLPSINSPYSMVDKFTLGSSNDLTGISYSEWLDHGDAPGAVSWEIRSSASSGVLASGTASSLTTSLTASGLMINQYNLDVYEVGFAISAPGLAAGDYYLWLQTSDNGGWGFANASAVGVSQQFLNGALSQTLNGVQSFRVYGDAPAPSVPEPASLALLSGGLLAVVRKLRRS